MIGYFAGCVAKSIENYLIKKGVTARLRSYVEFNNSQDTKIIRFPNMFLDSGAYSAFTRGINIDIAEYAEFIKLYKPQVAASLDVIGDAEATKVNHKKLEALGVETIPTIHFGADKKTIKYWMDGYKHIAVGGLVPHAAKKKSLAVFLDNIFSYARTVWPVKIHCFGLWSDWIHQRYPFHSADSTTWLAFSRYGVSRANMDEKLEHFLKKTKPGHDKLETEVDHYIRKFKFYTDLWNKRGITWEK